MFRGGTGPVRKDSVLVFCFPRWTGPGQIVGLAQLVLGSLVRRWNGPGMGARACRLLRVRGRRTLKSCTSFSEMRHLIVGDRDLDLALRDIRSCVQI